MKTLEYLSFFDCFSVPTQCWLQCAKSSRNSAHSFALKHNGPMCGLELISPIALYLGEWSFIRFIYLSMLPRKGCIPFVTDSQ